MQSEKMSIGFVIPGEPVAKGRPRATTVQKMARLYTPKKTVAYESTVALFGSQAMAGRAPVQGPVSMSVYAVFAPPQSWSIRRREANLKKPEWVTKRPDIDNLIKALCDGLNGVVFLDDSQVVMLDAKKVYGENPGVAVTVQEIE